MHQGNCTGMCRNRYTYVSVNISYTLYIIQTEYSLYTFYMICTDSIYNILYL